MNTFNRHILFTLFLTSLILWCNSSCERLDDINVDGFDCVNCYQQRPEWVQLNVAVTINSENPRVPLTIYIGKIEEGNVDWVDTTSSTNYWVDVKPDREYSVKAEYKDGSTIVYAIDGDNVKLRHTTTDCDQPCYYQSGGYTDVRLK